VKHTGERNQTVVPEETLAFRSALPAHPLPGGKSASPELSLVKQISPCLAVAGDSQRSLLLTGAADGTLRWYETKTLRLLGSCRLHQPAYQMALDAEHGWLYTASSPRETLILGQLGDCDHARGNICAYDVGSILDGKSTPTASVQPSHTLAVSAHVVGLALAPDGAHLCYMAETPQTAHVGRIEIATWTAPRLHWLPVGGVSAFAQAPDHGSLYALSGGHVFVFDPRSWQLSTQVRVGATITSLCVGRKGRVFFLERRFGMILHAVDFPKRKLLGRWPTNMDGRIYLRPSADGRRLYVGNSAVYSGRIGALDATAAALETPPLVGQVGSNPERLLRGTLLLSPDGKYVISGTGLVFRTPS
jgi:hypothetical protein